ncbi:hypothetical protein [Embleya sp. AB8]
MAGHRKPGDDGDGKMPKPHQDGQWDKRKPIPTHDPTNPDKDKDKDK